MKIVHPYILSRYQHTTQHNNHPTLKTVNHIKIDLYQHALYNQLTHTTHKTGLLWIDLFATPEIHHYSLNISTRTRTTQQHWKRNI